MSTPPDNPTASTIALGVTGSIAAYKAAEIASRLTQAGMDVHVLMTESATRLVQPMTFQTVSRNPVTTSLWDVPDWRPRHIALADRADLLVVAPATANFLAKYVHGIADDALSTFAISHDGPVIVAPAMNPKMWHHPATQENVRVLKERGVRFIGPDPGRVACGDDLRSGRMSEPAAILQATLATLYLNTPKPFARREGKKAVVTAGPTREMIDPVRFLSNRSSGKMGYALAAVAVAAGYETVLVSGPTALDAPAGVKLLEVASAAEMAEATRAEFANTDLLMMTAAVADYRPSEPLTQKKKKDDKPFDLKLERTEDILASLAAEKTTNQTVLGFAAETEDLERSAREKRTAKRLDWIVANDVGRDDIGLGTDENEVVLFGPGSEDGERLPKCSKLELAAEILKRVGAHSPLR
jgi:phosphopantothenoylcysteine decarboxylase/phosphopantothenate--cysteine ligase